MVTDATSSASFDRFEATTLSVVAGVAIVGTLSLLAAAVGVLRVWLWLPLSLGLIAALTVALLRSSTHLVAARAWWWVVPAVMAALFLMLPGFRYATGDKDPGIYVMHAWKMAHTGHLPIQKTALQMSGALSSQDYPGALWRGFEFSTSATQVMPSFFHMWPALLGAAFQLVGFRALVVVGPLLGALGVLLVFALVRRLFGVRHAALAALLLAVNMMQVWQSRYPTSEVLAQTMYVGAALALLIAVQTRQRVLGVVAGFLTTCGFLARGEGVVGVVIFGAVTVVLALAAEHRSVVRWAWGGLVLPLPLAWWQAYGWASKYTTTNRIPSSRMVALALVLQMAAITLLHLVPSVGLCLSSVMQRWLGAASRRLGRLTAVLVVVAFTIAFFRPLFGISNADRNGIQIRTFDERSLHRLALFFTWPGLLLAAAGVMFVAIRRHSRDVVAFALLAMVYVVLFLYHARNSPQMMWWNRRFVPSVVPALAIFTAVGIVDGWDVFRQWTAAWGRTLQRITIVMAALVALFCVAVPARQSWYLRANTEKGGSYGIATAVAALAEGSPAVFLWERGPCLLFGSPTWVYGGVDSGPLPGDAAQWPDYVAKVRAAAPTAKVFLVLMAGTQPPAGATYTAQRRFDGALNAWEESNIARPSHIMPLQYDFTVYRGD